MPGACIVYVGIFCDSAGLSFNASENLTSCFSMSGIQVARREVLRFMLRAELPDAVLGKSSCLTFTTGLCTLCSLLQAFKLKRYHRFLLFNVATRRPNPQHGKSHLR